jgi:adenylyltransferase/sulfurtransferase
MPLAPAADAALTRARVLIVGVGGLGAPAAAALAEAGVGTLGLVDPDVVELSNLHRQPLYDEGEVGSPKVEVAARRLRTIRPTLRIESERRRVDATDTRLVSRFDLILDGTDSIDAKFTLSDLAVATGRPLVHAGVVGLRGQILTILPGHSACYRCVFEAPPPPADAVSCTDAGVLGPLPALLGALQAAEAVRLLGGIRPLFSDRLLSIDAGTGTWRSIPLARRLTCAACGSATRSVAP